MSKPIPTLENILELKIEPYKSILNLLRKFQEHGSANGLQQKHIRYALCKNHGNMHPYTAETLESFYKDSNYKPMLPSLIKKGIIAPNSITSRGDLNNHLAQLLRYGIISKKAHGKKIKYRLSKDNENLIYRYHNTRVINNYPSSSIIVDSKEPSYDKPFYINNMLYGFPIEYYKEIKEHLEVIDSHLEEISKIKDSIISRYYKKKLIELSRRYDNERLLKFVKDKHNIIWDIFHMVSFGEYDGYLHNLIECPLDVKCSNKTLEKIKEKDSFKDSFLVFLKEHFGLTEKKCNEFYDTALNSIIASDISFSRYPSFME
jgi:hypothetical protein